MDIIIDGLKIKSKDELFVLLKRKIASNEFYGNNLDALWDILNQSQKTVNFIIVNNDELTNNLGGYYNLVLETLNQLAEQNSQISLQIL